MSLLEKVEQAQVAQTTGEKPGPTISELIERQKPEIARLLGGRERADRLARIALTETKRTPKLLTCTAASLLGALMVSAQMDLEPGPQQHCYLIPRWNGKSRRMEAQWMLGYRGIIELARRSKLVTSVIAREVCENDRFEFRYGLEERLVHEPELRDRGGPVAYYGIARLRDGDPVMLVMSVEEIEQRRARSENANTAWSPWNTDFGAMAAKSVIRAMAAWLPQTPELARAIEVDEGREVLAPNLRDFVPIEGGEPEPADGSETSTSDTPVGSETVEVSSPPENTDQEFSDAPDGEPPVDTAVVSGAGVEASDPDVEGTPVLSGSDVSKMTKAELVAKLTEYDLPTHGKVADLRARLVDHEGPM